MGETKTLRLAAVQMESGNHMTADNLSRARRLVGQAAAQGAQLVLLPELFSTGFEFTERAWTNAEPQGGPTERWLCETARGFGIHLGGSYMEAQGKDFVNTFALATPEGIIAGRVRKRNPCAMEAYLFKGQAGSHAIDTALGRIGIAICYDASLRLVNDNLIAEDIDLLLFPVSAPSPVKSWSYSLARVDAFHAVFRDGARHIAAGMGVPVALANKWGPWESAFVGPWPAQRSHFPGFSHVADGDGQELARVESGEGVAIAEIRLDPARKTRRIPPEADQWRPWVTRVPVEYRLFPLIEALGRRWYRRNRHRAAIAASVLKRSGETDTPSSLAPIRLIDEILENHRVALAGDFTAYRNHCQRVAHLCRIIASPDSETAQKFAIASAFHDLGIWTARSFDYLAPSRSLARSWLKDRGLEAWRGEIEEMIDQHHRVTRGCAGGSVETFRRADAIDLALGCLLHGVPRSIVSDLRRHYPNSGFHRRLLQLGCRHALSHPLAPLPMLRFGGGEQKFEEIPADAAITALLQGFSFADSYRFTVNGQAIDAPAVMAAIFRAEPAWVKTLMIVRNRVVQALGLQPVRSGEFPVLTETPDLVVLGLDDKHLDFRIALRVDRVEDDLQRVTLGTVVRPRNLLGRAYLGAVLPFHRRIVKAMLARATFPE